MKKKLKLIIGIVLVAIVTFLGYKITTKLNHKKEVAERIKTVPNFSFTTLNGESFTQNNLQNKPTIFVYFNSDCEYCQSETTKIQERLQDFKHTQLVFVSYEKKEQILQFAKSYKLDNQKNVTFLEDTKAKFATIFDVNSMPYIVVYDKNKQLLQKFKGDTKVDEILKFIE
ncbi:TlpA family protein disulfide reductase [Tenacibaculum larymnensis]|uniref:TlpA family protein disulfide reductase n=1 Tax=Tenacibaculum larymnensis TaxID=2878201 RepID=A0A9X4ELN1_9FLAO|nr:TlpA disulfide reductase family protein [Tenacibaculum larymnensis]MDE1206173.1 TlpA family protein disulfide reductase [Tenacibaculum larymnensis]